MKNQKDIRKRRIKKRESTKSQEMKNVAEQEQE